MSATALRNSVRQALADKPFHGEGSRKVWAGLRHGGLRTSKGRARRPMRENDLQTATGTGRPRGPAQPRRHDHPPDDRHDEEQTRHDAHFHGPEVVPRGVRDRALGSRGTYPHSRHLAVKLWVLVDLHGDRIRNTDGNPDIESSLDQPLVEWRSDIGGWISCPGPLSFPVTGAVLTFASAVVVTINAQLLGRKPESA